MNLNTYSLIINSFKNEHLFILDKLKKEINYLVIQNTQNIQRNQETTQNLGHSVFSQENQETKEISSTNLFSSKQESRTNLSFYSTSHSQGINSFSSKEKEKALILLISFYQDYQETFLNEINYLFKSLKLWELILCKETQTTENVDDENKNDKDTTPDADIEFRLSSIKLIKQDLENSNITRLVLFNSYLNLI